ncbi:MAG: hypothetical protein KGV50_04310 [Gammaproteobacteria bacterium]|nr:hypothetical protein [Gammaproteobacteria bacterium]
MSTSQKKQHCINLQDAQKIGSGSERSVYIHPHDLNKLVKIIHEGRKNVQSKRETKSYEKLVKRLPNTVHSWSHIPRFYGIHETSLGKGQVVEAIRDYDNSISQTLEFYLKRDGVSAYRKELDELKNYFLKHIIIFNHDIASFLNIVVKRTSETEKTLVVVDALGDHTAIKILNVIPVLARQKIRRRWERLEKKLLEYKQ